MEPNSSLAVAVGWVVLVLFSLVAIATIYLAVLLLVGLLIDYFRRRRALAQLRGSAVEVGSQQFPEIHAATQVLAQRLGMSTLPSVYVVEGNVINAAAIRLAGHQMVVLMDDVVDACLRSGDPRTLTFILSHELAHHALGHTGFTRSNLGRMLKWLSRLDEWSCDRVAHQLTGDANASALALTVLLIGPQILPYVNHAQLHSQARQVEADPVSRKAERSLSHPLLLRRLQRVLT